MSLSDLVKELEAAQLDADIELSVVHPSIAAGMAMRKGQAEVNLVEIKKKYVETARGVSIGVFVVGPDDKTAEFAQLGEEEGGGVTVSAKALYSRVAEAVDHSYGDSPNSSREFGTVQYSVLISELSDIGRELGIDSMARPPVPAGLVLHKADVYDGIKTILDETFGHSLNALYLENAAFKKALDFKYSERVLPVFVVGVSSVEDAENLSGVAFAANNHVVAIAEENISRDFVVKTLNALNKKTKKSKTN